MEKKLYYQENKEKIKEYQLERYHSLRKIFNDWRKTLFCERCGENEVSCLEFHHCIPSEKESNVIKMITRGLNSVIKEMKKCIVVCANCHCKIHAHDITTVPNEELSKSFKKFYDSVANKQQNI
jgi:hypothetical protein